MSLYIVIVLRIDMNDLKSYPYVIYFNMDLKRYKYMATNRQYHLQGMRNSQKYGKSEAIIPMTNQF